MIEPELISGYLRRLGLASPPEVSWPALRDLMQRHLAEVPFENLDIVAGNRVALSTQAALQKVVVRNRGGFCYELNEAFRALLDHLGFTVRRVEARVRKPDTLEFGPPYDHLALVVTLPEGEFLADVGFGDNNRSPMRLPLDRHRDVSGYYTLSQVSPALWRLEREDRVLYDLTVGPQPLQAFEPMHHYHQHSPDSLFAQGLLCTRALPEGRITIRGNRLIRTAAGEREEAVLEEPREALAQYFGIHGR